MFAEMFAYLMVLVSVREATATVNCRDRSNHLRHDGGLCFEIASWPHRTVEVDEHINKLKNTWASTQRRMLQHPRPALNSEVNRYLATVIAPFLDTYHRNIQTSYHQSTNKILKRIKDEINAALRKKQKIYSELSQLADSLNVPQMCDEEKRSARTLASKHVALTYQCTEEARASIGKMGKYAEEMITITRNHMQSAIADATQTFENVNVTTCLEELSRSAVTLGYELDLSLTNARRQNGQSCERLANCCAKVRRNTDDSVLSLTEYFNQCVYA
ncbi:uncharacterized protein LOC126965920 [Leptidea sinapis]|uniref:uncharacterized protein LOC126965920 n=1 Tax=Leptidea sinapis TaxID=189913 RepID=UPI0021C32449|nr:uncharacterized protein LOC126965920 [Leptidea sinapis]